MSKIHKLSTQWSVKAGVLHLTVEGRDADADKDAAPVAKFSRSVELAAFGPYDSLNDVGQEGLAFGLYTALRNATGSAKSISEAEEALDRRLAAWADGQWGADRESSATPFTANALIALAVERASGGDQSAAAAAERLCAMAEATCKANGKPEFAALEPADRAKVRKAVVDSIKESKPRIAAALAQLEAERALAAQQRKAEAAAKALAASDGDDDATL